MSADQCGALLAKIQSLLPNFIDPLENRLKIRLMAAVEAVGESELLAAAHLLAMNPETFPMTLGQWLDTFAENRAIRIAR